MIPLVAGQLERTLSRHKHWEGTYTRCPRTALFSSRDMSTAGSLRAPVQTRGFQIWLQFCMQSLQLRAAEDWMPNNHAWRLYVLVELPYPSFCRKLENLCWSLCSICSAFDDIAHPCPVNVPKSFTKLISSFSNQILIHYPSFIDARRRCRLLVVVVVIDYQPPPPLPPPPPPP